jgi:hypothetical protein
MPGRIRKVFGDKQQIPIAIRAGVTASAGTEKDKRQQVITQAIA